MSANSLSIHVGRWYLRWDKGEIFQVTGRDPPSGSIRFRTFDGSAGEMSESEWGSLPLGMADPPEDWTAPVEMVDQIDLEGALPPHP